MLTVFSVLPSPTAPNSATDARFEEAAFDLAACVPAAFHPRGSATNNASDRRKNSLMNTSPPYVGIGRKITRSAADEQRRVCEGVHHRDTETQLVDLIRVMSWAQADTTPA